MWRTAFEKADIPRLAKNQNTDNHSALEQAVQETDITVSYASTNITQ